MLTRSKCFRRSRRAVISLNLALSVPAWAAVIVVVGMAAQLRDDPDVKSGAGDRADVLLSPTTLDADEPTIITENVYPIPLNAPRQASRVVAGGGSSGSAAGGLPTTQVYDNTLSFVAVGPPSNLVTGELADDIATTADFGCNLDSYVVSVTGDLNGDSVIVGDLNVETWLYESCPRGATNTPSTPRRIADTQCQFSIPQASAGGIHELTCQIDEFVNIPLRNNFFVGVRFTIPGRGDAGVLLGAPALLGFSQDRFDHPSAACGAGLGGFPAGPQASFYGKVFVREPCGDTFVGYKNTRQNERGFSPGAGIRFADDIRLNVLNGFCNMVGLEVSVKGTGACLFDVRTCLNTDAENGCVIPGTRGGIAPTVNGVPAIGRLAFNPPIAIPQSLWASFRTTSAMVGPIVTGIPAGTGKTEDFYMVFTGGEWVQRDFPNAHTHAAFSVTITCDGLPPQGACCDMILTEERECFGGPRDGLSCNVDGDCTQGEGVCLGDSICREGAEVNCPFPQLWEEDGRCGPVCVGGVNDTQHCQTDADCPDGDCQGSFCAGGTNNGLACTRAADCPGASCVGGSTPGQPCTTNAQCLGGGTCRRAECPGPFLDSCGDSACCTYDDFCLDITERACNAYGDPDRTNLFQRGEFCNRLGQRCRFGGCFEGVGDCCENDFESHCIGGINDGDLCDYYFPPRIARVAIASEVRHRGQFVHRVA